MASSSQFWLAGMRGAALLAAVAVGACTESHSLQQVKSNNPSVTYEYRGDQELLQSQQNAVTYCNQYQSAPRPARITTGSNGDPNSVVFECDPTLPAAAPPQQAVGPNLTYSYRTDQELLDASRSAQAHCMRNGSQQAVANVGTTADGSRMVTFQCTPRA